MANIRVPVMSYKLPTETSRNTEFSVLHNCSNLSLNSCITDRSHRMAHQQPIEQERSGGEPMLEIMVDSPHRETADTNYLSIKQ